MGLDPLSPIAPARVGVLVLPLGRIRADAFAQWVSSLQSVQSVRLGDVTPDERPGRGTFSPLAFPDGRVYLDVSSVARPAGHADLAPFELFRTQLVVVGIVDAREYLIGGESSDGPIENGITQVDMARTREDLAIAVEDVQQQYPDAILVQPLVLNAPGMTATSWMPEGSLVAPQMAQKTAMSPMTVLCDITGRLLGELAIYADRVKSWASVPTPSLVHTRFERPEVDRDVDDSRRKSVQSFGSRASSPDRDSGLSPRPPSHGHSASNASLAGSPRLDSPSLSAEDSYTPETGSATETPTTANGVWKQKPRHTAVGADKGSDRSVFPTGAHPQKNRNVGKARVGIVIATLYLVAGRWPDAWKEFNEHVGKAKSYSDYLWLAFGLEKMLICMLLLGSEGFNFHIPPVCYQGGERQSTLLFADAAKDIPLMIGAKDSVACNTTLRRMGNSIGELVGTIMAYYDRAGVFFGEHLPQVVISELILRLIKLETFVASTLRIDINDDPFGDGKLAALRRPPRSADPVELSRLAISDLLAKAYPSPFADIATTDRVVVLSGMASTLAALNMDRKRGLVLRDLMVLMVPALQHARRAGAAELGIHPSSNVTYASELLVASSNHDTSSSISDMLQRVHRVYAVSERAGCAGPPADENAEPTTTADYEKLINTIIESAVSLTEAEDFGSTNLKIDILRESIDLCEALGDVVGIVQNASLLLRIAGPRASINPTKATRFVRLGAEEQSHVLYLLNTAAVTGRDHGAPMYEPEYWDEFLVRSVQLTEDEVSGKLIQHSNKDLTDVANKGPFLHDAFAEKMDKKRENIVVAGEPFHIAIVLQNPYDFDLVIDSIRLEVENGDVALHQSRVTLESSCLQEVICPATVFKPGVFKIMGCTIKISNCRERFFPIYNGEWRVSDIIKVKEVSREVPRTISLDTVTQSGEQRLPHVSEVALLAIETQPRLVLQDVSLRDRSLMLFEGEQRSFSIRLHNVSEIGIDFFHVSFEDSLTESLRGTLSSKEISRAALYDVEMDLRERPLFNWSVASQEGAIHISAGATIELKISVAGRVALRDVRVMFDYANLGGKAATDLDRFFVRQLTVPFSVTVTPSLQVHYFDIINPTFHSSLDSTSFGDLYNGNNSAQPSQQGTERAVGDTSIVVLDIRNASLNTIRASLGLVSAAEDRETATTNPALQTVVQKIMSGQVSRFAIPIRRLYVEDPHAPIPQSSSQARRQFVVSAGGESPQQERSMRELFWYREAFLKHFNVQWIEQQDGRNGVVNLRCVHINHRQVEALKLDDLQLSVSVSGEELGEVQRHQTSGSPSCSEVKTGQFGKVTVRIRNRSPRTVTAVLRLQPFLANQSQSEAVDLVSRRFIWTGLLQRPLADLPSGRAVVEELDFCILAAGIYEVGVVVEEAIPAAIERTEKEQSSADDEGIGELGDGSIRLARERRIWRLREPCLIRAT